MSYYFYCSQTQFTLHSLVYARNQYGWVFRQIVHITILIKSEDKGTYFPFIIRIFVPKFTIL